MKGYRVNASFLMDLLRTLSEVCDELYPKEITEGMGDFYKCAHLENGVSYSIEIE